MDSNTFYHHRAFGDVARVGLTRRLGVGPAVPCEDPTGKVRLLLTDDKYWVNGPRTREYQQGNMLKTRLKLLPGCSDEQRDRLAVALLAEGRA